MYDFYTCYIYVHMSQQGKDCMEIYEFKKKKVYNSKDLLKKQFSIHLIPFPHMF